MEEEEDEEGIKVPLLNAQNREEEGPPEVRPSLSTMDPNEHLFREKRHFSSHLFILFVFFLFLLYISSFAILLCDVFKKIRYPLCLNL